MLEVAALAEVALMLVLGQRAVPPRTLQGIHEPDSDDGLVAGHVTAPFRDATLFDPPAPGERRPRRRLASRQGSALEPIVLSDGPEGLALVSAPATLPLAVGHVAYLPVVVQGYQRPVAVTAQTLIHTFVNDLTPPDPGSSPPLAVGALPTAEGELKLQTLRMRPHQLTLRFAAGAGTVTVPLVVSPTPQPRSPLFSVHPHTPAFSGLTPPFRPVWGPDCGSCPGTAGDPVGSTRDIACAKQLRDSCRCHPMLQVLDSEADASVRREAPELQRYAFQFVRGGGGWGAVQTAPDRYLWTGLDWLFHDLSPQERDYTPLFTGVMDGNFGWMTCPQYTNPDGSVGFFDPANTFLVAQFAANVQAMAARYTPELRFIELSNEPAAEFYLCPCTVPGGPPCAAASGPNQPACALGPDSPEFVATYSDLLLAAATSASAALAAANPDALVITGALEMSPTPFGLSLTTEAMISRGLLGMGNVVIGVHQYPYSPPNWLSPTPDCRYFQPGHDPYWLPPGCETAPPFLDFTTPAGRPILARDAWRQFDERTDSSALLRDAASLGVLERFYLFDTELHAGWHDGDPTTSAARETIAGLRIGAVNAHQRVIGTEFLFAPADPAAYNVLVKHVAGSTPVYRWEAPLIGAAYSGLVYKLFTRGREDIIALWSNAAAPQRLELALAAGPTQFREVTLTRISGPDCPTVDCTAVSEATRMRVDVSPVRLTLPPSGVTVAPLREFYFLSVVSDGPGFAWLESLATSPPPAAPGWQTRLDHHGTADVAVDAVHNPEGDLVAVGVRGLIPVASEAKRVSEGSRPMRAPVNPGLPQPSQ